MGRESNYVYDSSIYDGSLAYIGEEKQLVRLWFHSDVTGIRVWGVPVNGDSRFGPLNRNDIAPLTEDEVKASEYTPGFETGI